MNEKTTLEECVVTFSRGPWDHNTECVLIEEWHDLNGNHHRLTDDPAYIIRDIDTHEVLEQRFYKNGELSREQGPAIIKEKNGLLTKNWYLQGKLHRDEQDGPSEHIVHIESGLVFHETWHKHGAPHRTNGPQYIDRSLMTGIVTLEVWKQNGKYFRADGGPTSIERSEMTGKIIDIYPETKELVQYLDLPELEL